MQYADRASQGGTSSLDVPPWMTSPKFKSWLSFVKIGKSVTTHMNKRIIKPAIKYGNFAPLIKFAMAGTYSGMAYNLFKTAFRVPANLATGALKPPAIFANKTSLESIEAKTFSCSIVKGC